MTRTFLRCTLGLLAASFVLAVAAPRADAADPKYRSQLSQAARSLMRGNAADAAKIYGEILEQHPTDEPAAAGYAQALTELGRYDEAEAFLGQALETISPKGNLYQRREQLRRRQGRLEDAFGDALHVMAEIDGLAPWAYQETRELVGEGLDPAKASRIAESARADRPDDVNFTVLTAVIVALDKRFPDADAIIRRSDEQKKQGGQTVMRYADELVNLGYREEGVAAMLEAAKLAGNSPRRSQFLFRAADVYEELGRYRDALAQLQIIAAEREGTSAAGKALTRSAEIYQTYLDDPRGALAVYEKLENDPSLGHNRPAMLLQMGECYTRLGRFDDAARTYREVIPEALDPEHAETAAFRLAEVEFYRGDPDSALTLYQDMAEAYQRSLLTDDAADRYILLNGLSGLDGGQAMAHFGRLEWARAVGDSAVADSTARLIIERYPDVEIAAESWLALAELSVKAGRPAEAIERLERVVTRYATDRRAPIALKREGDIYLDRLNDPQKALEKYESILADYPGSVLGGEVREIVQRIRKGIKS